MSDTSFPLARMIFSILVICGLMFATFWIVFPFLAAIVWATMIVIATWPLMTGLQRRLNGSRNLATTVMTLVLLGVFFVPLVGAIFALVGSTNQITAQMQTVLTMQVPPPPAWLAGLPLIGAKAAATWQDFSGEGAKELAAKISPYANQIVRWVVAKIGGLGALLGQLLLTTIIAAVLYKNGELAADRVKRFGQKLAGERGEGVVRLAGQAVRGIALGVVVTAVGQSLLSGIGLAIAGVPFAPVLTIVALILCIAQVGPILVLAPAVIWLYSTGQNGWGTFLLIWTLIVGTADNFVRPILIKKGADLPLILIFTGVIGGLVTIGLIGIFVGPVVLAVVHTLMEGWLFEKPRKEEVAPAAAAVEREVALV